MNNPVPWEQALKEGGENMGKRLSYFLMRLINLRDFICILSPVRSCAGISLMKVSKSLSGSTQLIVIYLFKGNRIFFTLFLNYFTNYVPSMKVLGFLSILV